MTRLFEFNERPLLYLTDPNSIHRWTADLGPKDDIQQSKIVRSTSESRCSDISGGNLEGEAQHRDTD